MGCGCGKPKKPVITPEPIKLPDEPKTNSNG